MLKKVIFCFSATDMSAAIRLQSAMQKFAMKTANLDSLSRELRDAMDGAGAEMLDTSIVDSRNSRR